MIINPELREPPERESAADLPLETVLGIGLATLPVSNANIRHM